MNFISHKYVISQIFHIFKLNIRVIGIYIKVSILNKQFFAKAKNIF